MARTTTTLRAVLMLMLVALSASFTAATLPGVVWRDPGDADAKLLGLRLSRLSGEQVRDGFRAAGYLHEDTEVFT